jgi:chemotaxis protein histidine kinase CheA
MTSTRRVVPSVVPTIRDEGDVSLILDVNQLMRRCQNKVTERAVA